MAIGIYKLTSSTGETVVLNVPRFSGDERLPGNDREYTITSATLELPEQFDHTATFFTGNETVWGNMVEQGFTNVILCSRYVGQIWTFENGNYITFESTGGSVYSKDGTQITIFPYPFSATTFISDRTNENWISGVYGWQGALYTVGADYFKFNYYYPDNVLNEESFHLLWDGNTPFENDPYTEGGTTTTGGGTGDFDGTGDAIDIPDLPTLSAVDTGFITIFNPSLTQLKNLANYMWSDLFSIDSWKKIFADPMNAILGLSIVPVAVPDGGTGTVTVGNISTGVSMTKANSQYVSVDCGTLNVNEFWGAYLDYEPYTKAEIYLPYCGVHPLAVDEIMGKAVHVVYHVDILSGAVCAFVKCGSSVLYTFSGQCSSSIPITGDNWTNVINGVITMSASIGTMVATGGATAPTTSVTLAQTAINDMKPSIEKSGAIGSTSGMLAVQTPYLILTRPRQALPENQNTYTGYPSFITTQLNALSGYTEIESIHLTGIPATDSELTEIENLLKTGVIF